VKYSSELDIELPRQRVIELFDDPENLPKWQPGLESFELVDGVAGQPGARSRLVYDMYGRRVEMFETIVRRNLPDEFSATFEGEGVKNWISNRFYEDGPDRTRWVMENEFKFSGIMALMSVFMRGAFSRQTLEDMARFKEYAESA
jgi:uncharacterized membrane protein